MDIGAITKVGGVSSANRSCLTGTASAALFGKNDGQVKVFVVKPKGCNFTGGVKMEIISVSNNGTLTMNLSLVPVELNGGTTVETTPSDIRVVKDVAGGESAQAISLSTTTTVTLAKEGVLHFGFRTSPASEAHYTMFRIFNRAEKLHVALTNSADGLAIIE